MRADPSRPLNNAKISKINGKFGIYQKKPPISSHIFTSQLNLLSANPLDIPQIGMNFLEFQRRNHPVWLESLY